ncbi:MAG: right-handed parallel beta-helix repeat-containing protein [bacterium]
MTPSIMFMRCRVCLVASVAIWMGIASSGFSTTYYVNDANTNFDVYCSAVGNPTNSGTNAASPMATLGDIVTNFALVAGDVVYIDTGTYSNQTTLVTASDTGAPGNSIIFQGSTNYAHGGTVLDRQNAAADVIVLSFVSNLKIRDLTVKGGRYGIWCFLAGNIELERIIAQNNDTGFSGDVSPGTKFTRCVAFSNTYGLAKFNASAGSSWNRCVSWRNASAFSFYDSTFGGISNSVIVGGVAFAGTSLCPGDYNVFWDVEVGGGFNNLAGLQMARNDYWHSTYADPLFFDGGNQDFHPLSTMGRFDPAVGHHVTNDTQDSVLIDFGDPKAAFSNELDPNGSRLDAGMFGNTEEASQSPTSKYVMALSYNDGGLIEGTGVFHWTYRNLTNTFMVDVQYTTNEGSSWVVITNGIPVTNSTYTWDASSQGSNVIRWRVVGSGSNTNVVDANDGRISLNGALVPYYVNDDSTNTTIDVYCSVPGSDTNSGIAPDSPMRTITNLFKYKKVNPRSIVYVDTGIYSNYTVTLNQNDAGTSNGYVIIQGSTNYNAGGSILDRKNSDADALVIYATHYVQLKDMTIMNGRYGLWLYLSDHIDVDRVTARNNVVGFFGDVSPTCRFTRCEALYNTYGLAKFNNSAGTVWDLGLSWSNDTAFSFFDYTFGGLSNSVIVGGYAFDPIVPTNADFNALWSTTIGCGFQNLVEVQKSQNSWWHSAYVDDPLFVNPEIGDFHPKSSAGHFDRATETYTNDAVDSPLVDFGDPSHLFANEPNPHGARVNAGSFGDTSEASKTRTNAWLIALTCNDGGTVSAPADTVYWTGGNLSNLTVRIELSTDSGDSWQVMQTNLTATDGSYAWANTNFGSSLFARWRVVVESDTNVYDATGTDATFKSGPFFYYLNDTNLTGDIYTTAAGSDTNLGTSPGKPKLTLQSVLDNHDIEPSDIIFIDTGNYMLNANPVVTVLDMGNATNHVIMRGSANAADGGTVFDRRLTNSTAYALHLSGAGYLDIQDMAFVNAGTGVRVDGGEGVTFIRTHAGGCGRYGWHVRNASLVAFDRSVASSNDLAGLYIEGTEGVKFDNGVFWKNATAGIRVDSGSVLVSNSVVVASGRNACGYYAASINNILGNYNDLYTEDSAIVGFIASMGRNADVLSSWSGLTTQETHSISADPLFADPDVGDFHPKTDTPTGRYVPGLGYVATDPVLSPLIDSGSPQWAYTNEPAPNGNRVDMGIHGNTVEASKGRTSQWLFAATHRQGGWARGTSILHWVAGNYDPTGTVNIEVSTDGGLLWTALTNGIPATNESLRWDTRFTNDSPACLWSITDAANTNIGDCTTNFFAIRNTNLSIYVNNAVTNDDMFTTAPGVSNNWRASSDAPIDALATVFRLFDVEPGDRIFVDSGPYTNPATILVDRMDSGSLNAMVQVTGSTTGIASAVVMYRSSPAAGAHGLVLENAGWVSVSNLVLRGGNAGVVITNSQDLALSVRSQNNASNGVLVYSSSRIDLSRQVVANNLGPGIALRNVSDVKIGNSIIWSNAGSAITVNGGAVTVSNTVIAVGAGNAYAYDLLSSAVVRADYNDVFLSATVYAARVGSVIYKNLSRWQQIRSNDIHSLSHDPLFADAAGDDYHLKSAAGRLLPGVGLVTDVVSSLLIDAADPEAGFSVEPSPNGSRMNMGLFGNTAQESRTPTNGWLVALTLSSGGSIGGTNALYWVPGGSATDDLVYIDYSCDEGVTWTNIATNIAADAGYVTWTSTTFISSTRGIWRIVSQSDTNLADETDSLFALNNDALSYYVNDDSTVEDVYTFDVGSSANDGLLPSTPKRTIEQILAAYDVGPGDHIYVDTGVYEGNSTILIGQGVAGSSTNLFVIQGSTNAAAGGTVLNRGGADVGIEVRGTEGIALRNLVVTNASRGILIMQSTNCLIEGVRTEGGRTAFEIRESFSNVIRQSVGYGFLGTGVWSTASADGLVEDSFLYTVGRSGVCIRADSGQISISNCVLWAEGWPSVAYSLGPEALLASDYNNIVLSNGAYAARQAKTLTIRHIEQVSRLSRDFGVDRHSLTHDPGFFDMAGRDFHPASLGGRYEPSSDSFVTDLFSSVLIDAGDANASYAEETAPNGSRRNMGVFGDTGEASRTATNVFFTCVSLNDGGRAEGTNVVLYWVARGNATGMPVKLEYSPNGSSNWVTIATSVPGASASYAWDTTSYTSSPFAAWRIMNPTNLTEYDRTDVPFALRNQPFTFYVNDASTNNDVYTKAEGSSINLGIDPSGPKGSLQEILDTCDLEAGDIVYIDTGTYTNNGEFVLKEVDGGDGSDRVVFVGSTNAAAGGTVFDHAGILIYENVGIELRNISLDLATNAGSATGIHIERSTNVVLQNVRVRNGGTGFHVDNSANIRMERCVAAGMQTNGLLSMSSQGVVWQSGVLWSNAQGVVVIGGSAAISNSIVAAFGSGRFCIYVSAAGFRADYNNVYAANGAMVAYLDAVPEVIVYNSLSRWSRDTGLDRHSLSQWPDLADPGSGDFHLRSEAGRYVSWARGFTNDLTTSPLVDTGDPAAPFSNEPTPNGNRINIGLYGDSPEASKTPTNPVLTVVSLNDGGQADGTNTVLFWIARGAATSDLVRIEASPDAGSTWQVVASNIPAGSGSYAWDATSFTTTVLALWRVTSQTSTSVTDQSDMTFAVRNSPVDFYVNDSSTNGDMYCTAVGSATNLGLTASAPLPTLALVLNAYDLESGDTVFMDTGVYSSQGATTIGQLDSAGAVTTAQVTIQGSTDMAAGGTVIDGGGAAYALDLDTVIGLALRNLVISNASTAVRLFRSHESSLDWIHARTVSRGFEIVNTAGVTMRHCVARESQGEGVLASSSSGLQWLNGVLWSNNPYGIRLSGSSITVSNSVIAVFGTNGYAYHISGGNVVGDYNDVYLQQGALAAFRSENPDPIIYETVSRWARDTTQDVHSLTHNPGFQDPSAGDFHLRSPAGRYVVTSTNFVVTDTNTSLLIDAADPASVFTNETSPNGARMNIGLYGNTFEASRSSTSPSLTVVNFNDGGRAEGANVLLYWVAGGVATGHPVRLAYSADAGATWQPIATNVPATNRSYVWNSLYHTSSVRALWQITSEVDTNISDCSDGLFALRNTPLAFYVNDQSTLGDVYTQVAGSSTNLGFSPELPIDSIQTVLNIWDIEPGDTVFVDTGTYMLGDSITITPFDAGLRTDTSSGRVTIQGSTNQMFGGSVLKMISLKSHDGIVLSEANCMNLLDLTVRDAKVGVLVDRSNYGFLQCVRAERCVDGLKVSQANPVEFRNCSAIGCDNRGLISIGALANTFWQNGLLWSNKQGAVMESGSLEVKNSILGSFREDAFAFVFKVQGKATSDYNNIVLENGAFAGAIVTPGGFLGGTSRHETVAAWVENTRNDLNTLTFDPQFVNPTLGDYHLVSRGGRYDPFVNAVVTDSISSLLIDSGSPDTDSTAEPEPNGGRVNIDLYGGTWQASKTPTNGWLSIISLNDGGDVSGTNVQLRFFAGWVATGHLVYADYSTDNGATWTNIFTNHPASSNIYVWNSTNYPRSATARWRIIDQEDTGVCDTNDATFVLRTGGTIPYYVNDDSTVGDVYCSNAVGNDLNSGLYPTSPVRNIQLILSTNRLQPRDVVFVDTGIYPLTNSIVVGDQDGGKGTNELIEIGGVLYPARVVIVGSTNVVAGGSIVDGQGLPVPAFNLLGTRSVEIRNFRVINAGVGVAIDGSIECVVDSVRAEDNRLGFRVSQGSSDILISHSIARNSLSNGFLNDRSSVRWESGVIWDNPGTVVLEGGQSTFRNSAFNASGSGGRIFRLSEFAVLTNCDYNNIVRESGALVGERQMGQGGNEVYPALIEWTTFEGQDANSLSHQPLFADEGNGDFHLQSGTGRFVPGVGYATDTVFSPMIDLGDPSVTLTNEPAPNGGILNIGAYGNTTEASLSQTNPWLLVLSLNDGGVVSDTGDLRWEYGNMPGTSLVRLAVSVDGGIEYDPLASNIPVSAKSCTWQPCSFPLTSLAKWKITSQAYTNVSDEVDGVFVIKCEVLDIYVNDLNTNGDIFCTALGHPDNSGLSPSDPLLDPSVAFTKYYVSGGDTIRIDTGQYVIDQPETGMVLTVANRGAPTAPITIHGSTNDQFGGTVIDRANSASGVGLLLHQTRYVEVDHIKIKGAAVGVQVSDSRNCRLDWVECYSNANDGFSISVIPSITARHCTAWNNGGYGLVVDGNSDLTFENGVLWSNARGAVQVSGATLYLSNSILHSATPSSYLYAVESADLHSDFNFLYKPPSNGLARNWLNNLIFLNLKKWQDAFSADKHSVMMDPLLANPAGGDFHLRSQAGRFEGSNLVQDTDTSWAIDAGGFGSPYAEEPLPNGSRHNVGLYGNTGRASLSTSVTGTPELVAVRLNDGGTVEGDVELYWLYRGMPATNRVRLEVSLDDGSSWRIIATNVSVSDQGYQWANTNPASPMVRWRVVSESNTNLFDVIDTNFVLRVGPIYYYVNDTSTVDDVYTTVAGSRFNSGLSNGVPLDSIQAVFDRYDVAKGDIIYVDTGIYTNRVIIGAGDVGSATSRIVIVGSTNRAAAGSIVRLANSASNAPAGVAAFRLEYTEGFELCNFTIEHADIGIDMDRCDLSKVTDVLVRSCRSAGIHTLLSGGNLLERVVVTRVEGVGVASENSGNTIFSSVIWSNASHAVRLTSSNIQISNSVLSAHGAGNMCLLVLTNSSASGDYNCYTLSSDALYAVVSGIPIEGLPQLTAEGGTTQDIHSLSVDPLFADPANDDFHVRSQSGRFDPVSTNYVTTDTVTSLLIDTGDPDMIHTNEPAPNGGRRNIGLYGNTTEASKSRTNAWLFAITASSGGNVEGYVYLVWAWGGVGIDATNSVILDYSFNNGLTWTNIATVQVSSNSYFWNSAFKEAVTNEKWPSSPLARWRLTLEGATNITDTTDSHFALHNRPFFYYCNDTSMVEDVYTANVGSDTNLGLFPDEPMLTLANLLQVHDVQGTDTILLDTGLYVLETNNLVEIGLGDQGSTNKYVVLQGSTNYAAGGTVISKGVTITDSNIVTVAASFFELRDLRIVGGGVALVGAQTACTNLVLTNGSLNVRGNGSMVRNVRVVNGGISMAGTNVILRQVQVFGDGAMIAGANILVENCVVYVTNGIAMSLFGDQITLRNNTIVSKGTAFQLINSTTFNTLENNILVADGLDQEAFCILRQGGFLLSDYNNLVARNGAWIGNANGKWEKLGYWQRESLLDTHSLADEPLFADEAGLDFHLKSKTGRFLNGSFVTDAVQSPAIDAGKPGTAVGSELAPNGGRINLGAHGGTPEASKSLTNGWFTLLTANDGGVLKGTNVTLQWNSFSFATSSTITIQYSPDSGSTWTTIVTGLSATNKAYTWNSTLQTSSLSALLRIFQGGDTSVVDQTDSPFALRNVPLSFYVNDTSMVGDVYTTTNGSPSFSGLTREDPLHSIQAVLTNYDVESLDTIYVDTGLYPLTSDVLVIWSDGGDSAGNLTIQGSTNVMAGGTVIARGSQAEGHDGFDVKASHVTLRDMAIHSAYRGVFFDSNRFSSVERLLLYSNVSGVANFKTSAVTNRNLRLWRNVSGIDLDNSRTTVVENCTFVGNSSDGILVVQAFSNVVQNNIFYLSVPNSVALSDASNILDVALVDYNVYYFATNNVTIDGVYTSLIDRQREIAKDFRSHITNPLLQDANGGDFHLKSVAGRFQDSVNGFVTDTVDSWGIDHGNPDSAFTNEPLVNGARVNIGAYGNTEYASKGSTCQVMDIRIANTPSVLSTNDNPLPVIWSWLNTPTGATVRVEYSGDGGLTWTALATNIPVRQEYILWNLSPIYNTYGRGLLRVVGEGGNPYGIGDTNNAPIDLFFGEFDISSGTMNTNAGMIVWRGAWGENYQVQYADMFMLTNGVFAWSNAVNGGGANQQANFQSTLGGDFIYEDPQSTASTRRIYRVILEQYEP